MRFKRIKKITNPEMSTASLPDIVFMLLFFFMVTTVIQDEKPMLEIEKPRAVQTEKIEQKDLTASLLVGMNTENRIPLIQWEDRFISIEDLGELLSEKRASLPESMQGKFTTILKADKALPMEVITKIKQQLREYQLFKIQYAVETESY
jgi:biopolymer transport protein ExbD